MMGAWEKIVPALERLSGDTGVYLCNLVTGDMRAYAADKPVVAASVIKIPVMIEVFRQARDGLLDLNEIHRLSDDERLPSCGTLKAMHTGIEMTLLDLTRLMVIVSDNAATNILIRRVGMENVNRTIRELGCEKTCLRSLTARRLRGALKTALRRAKWGCCSKSCTRARSFPQKPARRCWIF